MYSTLVSAESLFCLVVLIVLCPFIICWISGIFVRQERQHLEGRLDAIESKQRQLEAQDKLIAEALSSTCHGSFAEGLRGPNDGRVSDMHSYHIPGEYPVMSEHLGGTQLLSSSVTNVTSSRPVSIPPNSSHGRLNAEEIAVSYIKPGMVNGLPVEPDHVETSADSEVDTCRVREYHNELLQRQTDRQNALLEARQRLQMRAEQLLDSGLNFLSESPSHKHRTVNHSQSLTVLSDRPHLYDVEHCGFSSPSGKDVPRVENDDVLQTRVDVTKPYKPQLYRPKSLSEGIEGFEYNVSVTIPAENDTDDERQFVTPEFREGGRVRPCRVAEYSPSPSPHAADVVASRSQQPPTSHDYSNKDDFNSLILQAQKDLSIRQRQMQDQLEALEHEERRLAEQQLRIGSQLGSSFPPNIPTFPAFTHSQQLSVVSYPSSLSDLQALIPDRVCPSLSAQNAPDVSQDNIVSRDGVDTLGLKSDEKGRMAEDNSSRQTVSRETHESRSAPQLQSHDDHSVMPITITSEQLSPSGHLSPVSTVFCLC